jgi:hypothetical protein
MGKGFGSASRVLDMAAAHRTTNMLGKAARSHARKAAPLKGLGGIGLGAAAVGGGYGYYQSKQGNYSQAAMGIGAGIGGLVLGGKSLSKGIGFARKAADARFAMGQVAEVAPRMSSGRISSAAVAGSAKRTARAVASSGRRSVSQLPTGPSRGAVSSGSSGVTAEGILAYRNQAPRGGILGGGIFS